MRCVVLPSALVMCALLTGCRGSTPQRAVSQYDGPTDTMAEVVRRINERNGAITTLRCEGDFRAVVKTDTKTETIDGTVTLLYRQSQELRLVGQVLTERAFDLGTNAERYWLSLPTQDTMWWGYHRLIGGAGARRLPVRPDLIRQVLEVAPIETDFLREPVPTLRFNRRQDAYVLSWQVQLSDRWVVQKEVWYERETLRPVFVFVYDENGRMVVDASLSKHAPISGLSGEATMATSYRINFPDTGSRFEIDLLETAARRGAVPGPRSFDFPGDRAGVGKVIAVDE